MMEPQIISEFPKNKKEDFRLSLTEYEGYDLLDFRVFFKNEQGDSIPTKRGVTMNIKLLPQLKEAILNAEKILNGDDTPF